MKVLVLVLVLASLALPAAAPAAASDPVVRASVRPASVGVGDVFSYVVETRLAAGGREPQAGDFRADGGVFRVLEPPQLGRVEDEGVVVVRFTQLLACLDDGCVPRDGSRRLVLPAARVRFGGTVVAAVPVAVAVRPRVTSASVAAGARGYRRGTALPSPEGRVGATAAVWLLGAGGLAFAAAAVVLAAAAGLRLRRQVREDGLARAIRLLRESARHPSPDRRVAADLLAQEIGRPETVAEAATELAWSPPTPTAVDVESLAARAAGGRA